MCGRCTTIISLVFILMTASVAAEQAPHDMTGMPASWSGSEQIAMLVYPGFTALDLVGPQYMFGNLMGARVLIVAETLDPVPSDTGIAVLPTATYADVPEDLTVLFVPGGAAGTLAAIRNQALIRFVHDRGTRARYVTSVCTGSLVLGAAGLLDGYRATSHWLTHDLLPTFGAVPVRERIVRDRNRITGSGVTSGLDFGLLMLAELRDSEYAQIVQLLAEYAPEPPFSAGSPDTAPDTAVRLLQKMFAGFDAQARKAIKAATEMLAPASGSGGQIRREPGKGPATGGTVLREELPAPHTD